MATSPRPGASFTRKDVNSMKIPEFSPKPGQRPTRRDGSPSPSGSRGGSPGGSRRGQYRAPPHWSTNITGETNLETPTEVRVAEGAFETFFTEEAQDATDLNKRTTTPRRPPMSLQKFQHQDDAGREKWLRNKEERGRRFEFEWPSDRVGWQYAGPPDFVFQLLKEVEQLREIFEFTANCDHPNQQAEAYERMANGIQVLKQMRNLYNRCIIDCLPIYYQTINAVMKELMLVTRDPNVELWLLAKRARELMNTITYFRRQVEPWRATLIGNSAAMRRARQYEELHSDVQNQLQIAKNRIQAQDPDNS